MSRFSIFAGAALSLCLLAPVAASAQYYKLHNADITFSGTGPLTTNLTNNGPASVKTTDSTGFLLSLRDHPVAWAGIEINYGYNRFSEVYQTRVGTGLATLPYSEHIQTNVHEATAAYMFHPHFMHLQPFVNIGGGALNFISVQANPSQWRGAGLVETGFDIPAGKHGGFRVQGRALVYRAPNFQNASLQSRSWVVTEEPSLGAYLRF